MTARHLIDLAVPIERAFLVAVDTGTEDGWSAADSLAELANLATTAGADVVGAEWQNRRHVDPNWYVGKGKAEDLVAAKRETGFDLLVADDELSPAQQRALEELLNVKVIDRSRLILDIFALHAQTHEGRLQVELAQLEYQLPRLTRLWTHLSRTQGGIGSRGPGESQLETDRRIIRTRIAKMTASSRCGRSARPPLAGATGAYGRPSASSATRTPASRHCSTPSSGPTSPTPRTSCSPRSIPRVARSSSVMARRRS
jgi:50S ribosomal subunit-associated GTPase HflX